MASSGATGPRSGPGAALRVAPYRRWFVAQVFSASGASTQLIGMSWLVTAHTDNGLALGLLTGLVYLPILLLGPWAGRLIDQRDRRRMLLLTQVVFVLVGAALALSSALGFDSLAFLLTTALVTGLVNALDAPARQVYLQDVLPRTLLPAAIGLYEVLMNAARVLGPGVAGLLLAWGGATPTFVFNAVCFLPALWALVRNRDAERFSPPATGATGARVSVWEGLRWSLGRPDIAIMLVFGAVGGMLFNLPVVMPLVTTRDFHLGAGGYGFFVAMFGVGALVGALRASAQRAAPRARPTTVLALATGVLVIVTALLPGWPAFAVGMAAVGCVSIWFIARANAYVQLEAPAHIRGQVMSVWNMAIPGMDPFTGLLAGWVADAVDPRAGFALPGAFFVLGAAAALVVLRPRSPRP